MTNKKKKNLWDSNSVGEWGCYFVGLLSSGMGKGPALSLPSMLVIRSIMGTKKTLTYIALVVVMATFTGIL